MKKRFPVMLALGLAFLAACSGQSFRRDLASNFNESQAQENAELDRQLNSLQNLVEEALVWRTKATSFYVGLKNKIDNDENLSAGELEILYSGAEAYMDLRKRIYTIVLLHEKLTVVGISDKVGSPERILALKKIKLALGAALVLYDNYMIGIYPYYENKKLRRLLSRDRPGIEKEIHNITENYLNVDNRHKLAFGMSHFIQEQEEENYKAYDQASAYLDELIKQSPTFQYLKDNSTRGSTRSSLRNLFRRIADDLNYLGRIFTYVTSMVFGNGVGLIEARKGYMLSLTPAEKKGIADRLEPLDVLLEKTPFRLTDKFIPGHWGHVAIWVGTEEQIKEIGLWDHPAVKPHQAKIRAGHHIVEALRPGVQINTLEHFLNIDDFLAVRHSQLSSELKKKFLLKTFQQIGKAYDFNFDVETDERIVCSEIAYVVFTDVKWPTDKQLGRYTISPDHVAEKAVAKNPFYPVILYHEGNEYKNELEKSLQLLLQEQYEEFRRLHETQ